MTADPKTIVITGVSRGLGLALVKRFAAQGHRVVGCSRSGARVEELAHAYPAPSRFDVVDVADDQEVKAWADSVLTTAGAPDLLLNNAALMNKNAPLWEVPVNEFSGLIDVNVKGVFHVIRHFLPAMSSRRTGVIVNFSSGWGRSASPEVAPYCASKWAIEGLSRALAQELPRGMACIALNPGVIHTEMLESCFGAGASAYPSAEQWAKQAAPFLLGLDASNNGDAMTAPM